jgi:dephospho-CoA kinase
MILGLTGTYAAGKGTVSEYLIGKGFMYYSLSDELRFLLRERGIMPTRENLITAANSLRVKYGPSFLADLVIRRLKGTPSIANSIVDSIRNVSEIAALRDMNNFSLVCVDAPIDIRYERARKRNTERDPKSFSQFMVQEKREMAGKDTEQQLAACMREADFTIKNDGNFKKLYKEIDSLLAQIKARNAVKEKQNAAK